MRARVNKLVVVMLVVAGCAPPPMVPMVTDAGLDAGDATVETDSGVVDAGGAPDAGEPDAGAPDAGAPDAGPPCPEGQAHDPAGTCVQAPILDVIACPAYQGLACVLRIGPVDVGSSASASITLRNTGVAPLVVRSATLDGGSALGFQVTAVTTTAIGPQAYGTVTVRFSPLNAGAVTDSLRIESNAQGPARRVPVEGFTTERPCGPHTDCLTGEQCVQGLCSSCPMPTPPKCTNGQRTTTPFGNGCASFGCQCPSGQFYVLGTCFALAECTGPADCAPAETCDPNVCSSSPCGARPSVSHCRP